MMIVISVVFFLNITTINVMIPKLYVQTAAVFHGDAGSPHVAPAPLVGYVKYLGTRPTQIKFKHFKIFRGVRVKPSYTSPTQFKSKSFNITRGVRVAPMLITSFYKENGYT